MNEDQRRELLLLADGLETVPLERFDMRIWGRDSLEPGDCGFAGCAIGWARKFIPDCGLRLTTVLGSRRSVCWRPAGSHFIGTIAVSRYFGIQEVEVKYLFLAGSYPYRSDRIPPTVVSARIRQFLAIPRMVPHE